MHQHSQCSVVTNLEPLFCNAWLVISTKYTLVSWTAESTCPPFPPVPEKQKSAAIGNTHLNCSVLLLLHRTLSISVDLHRLPLFCRSALPSIATDFHRLPPISTNYHRLPPFHPSALLNFGRLSLISADFRRFLPFRISAIPSIFRDCHRFPPFHPFALPPIYALQPISTDFRRLSPFRPSSDFRRLPLISADCHRFPLISADFCRFALPPISADCR